MSGVIGSRSTSPVSGDQLKEITNEPVPNPFKQWRFCFGRTLAYWFQLKTVTGILAAVHEEPSPERAWLGPHTLKRVCDSSSFILE